MSDKRETSWKINKKSFTESEENLLESEEKSLHLVPQNSEIGQFGGAKRKNFNELWRWDTLEDVDFK